MRCHNDFTEHEHAAGSVSEVSRCRGNSPDRSEAKKNIESGLEARGSRCAGKTGDTLISMSATVQPQLLCLPSVQKNDAASSLYPTALLQESVAQNDAAQSLCPFPQVHTIIADAMACDLNSSNLSTQSKACIDIQVRCLHSLMWMCVISPTQLCR